MLKIFKAILRNAPKANSTTVAADKLFKACRDILQVNGSNLHPPFGFKLSVGQSKLPNAGYGIIVSDGRVKKGDVVCLYSGKYFPPPPVWSLANVDGEPLLKPFHISKALPSISSPEQEELAAAYRIHCNSEGGYIDGIEYTPYADKAERDSEVSRINMPYSSAQLINHPARGIQPNVYFHDFNWNRYLAYTKEIDTNFNVVEERKKIEKINKLGEGPWYYDPTSGEIVPLSENCTSCMGLATIATRDIEPGEEIYLDYKYHKDDQPAWYTPVKYSE
eukprot:gene13561-15605_t